jgi:hypothetical protein
MPEVDLAFIARQLERLVNDMAGLKDDMMLVMARLDRSSASRRPTATRRPDGHRSGAGPTVVAGSDPSLQRPRLAVAR